MARTGTAIALGSLLLAASLGGFTSAQAQVGELTLTSTAFADGEPIPLRNSAYGDNLSPPLAWTGVPEGSRSFALVLDDPDAPMPVPFVHWVIYNIPAAASGLPQGLATDAHLHSPAELMGAAQGPAGTRRPGYFGPRPPAGRNHTYRFTLYALDLAPGIAEGLNKDELMEAIEGHVLAETVLTGTFAGQ
jgi:Raf kinase inhibitor-like YbhB/YbcL family protein